MINLLKTIFYRKRSQISEKPDPLPPIQIQKMSKEELLLFAKTNEAVQTILEEKIDFTLVMVAFNQKNEEIYIMRRWGVKIIALPGHLQLWIFSTITSFNYGRSKEKYIYL